MAIAYISHPDCRLHDMGSQHPECPARLSAIDDHLGSCGLDDQLRRYTAPPATRDQLETAHDLAYIDAIYAAAPNDDGIVWIDADTAMNSYTLRAAERAAGAVARGVDLVMAGDDVRQAFCAVRPPGHHAERRRAMGFCLFNNVAVGAYYALLHHDLERVAVVDFDVHHGNGSEDIFADDGRVLFCSTFQHPFYPHSGHDCASANVVNTALPAGTSGDEFRRAVTRDWLPRLEEFAPQLILVSAGFDAHRADQLAGLDLVEADYAWVTRQLIEQARRSARGRIVSTLEGGYQLDALARSVEAHLRALLGGDATL